MEEEAVLSGDNAFNAHFGECIAAIGDIDDDGYQGQFQPVQCPLRLFACLLFDCITWSSSAGSLNSSNSLHIKDHLSIFA